MARKKRPAPAKTQPENNPPQTIAAAVAVLVARLDPPYAAEIRAMREADLISLHHDLGMVIRNSFGLWEPNSPLRADCGNVFPDEAALLIIHALWRQLQSDETAPRLDAPGE